MKNNKNNIRVTIQIVTLSLILYVAFRPYFDKSYLADFEKYCPFGGISSFFSKLNNGTMACNMNETQVILGIVLLFGAGLIGKLFCSFICPVGSITEWLGKIGEKFKIRKEISGKIDKYLRSLKYALLFITIYYTMTSSELFCKVFDPYFASVNLFNNNDIILYYAVPAFLITIAGSLFFRLFWCKYLCPLGALSNIFMNGIIAGAVITIYLTINYFGAGINFVWLLGGLVISGLINEIGFTKSFFLPIPKIMINDACSKCGFCDMKCPQGIEISKISVVNHIDCNLCTDCVYACPKKNVVTVNKRNYLKYLSPVMVLVLISFSLGMTNYFEFKTISLRWGKAPEKEAVYTKTGLKNIKCYGSSMALAGTLEGVQGIHGLDTYTKTHTVQIYYDPLVLSEEKVKSVLFTPMKVMLAESEKNISDAVGIYQIGIYGLFDQLDFENLYNLLNNLSGILGFETHFGEPVITVIYYNPTRINPDIIKSKINANELIINKNGIEEKIDLDLKAENNGIIKDKISFSEFKKIMFDSFEETFGDFENYSLEQLNIFKFSMPEAANPELKKSLIYLVSHLSGYEGIVKFSTGYSGKPFGYVYYDPKKISPEAIKPLLTVKKFLIYTSDTETEEMDNPFHINPEGEILKADELK